MAENDIGLLCVTNVTSNSLALEVELSHFNLRGNTEWIDLFTGETFSPEDLLRIELVPYQSRWLKVQS